MSHFAEFPKQKIKNKTKKCENYFKIVKTSYRYTVCCAELEIVN